MALCMSLCLPVSKQWWNILSQLDLHASNFPCRHLGSTSFSRQLTRSLWQIYFLCDMCQRLYFIYMVAVVPIEGCECARWYYPMLLSLLGTQKIRLVRMLFKVTDIFHWNSLYAAQRSVVAYKTGFQNVWALKYPTVTSKLLYHLTQWSKSNWTASFSNAK